MSTTNRNELKKQSIVAEQRDDSTMTPRKEESPATKTIHDRDRRRPSLLLWQLFSKRRHARSSKDYQNDNDDDDDSLAYSKSFRNSIDSLSYSVSSMMQSASSVLWGVDIIDENDEATLVENEQEEEASSSSLQYPIDDDNALEEEREGVQKDENSAESSSSSQTSRPKAEL